MRRSSMLGVCALLAPLTAMAAPTPEFDDAPSESDVVSGAVNAAYELSGARIKLRSGMLKQQTVDRAARSVITSMWGAPAVGDLNGDGRQDAALILIHEPGGSRTLYYVAACVSRRFHKQCKGTMAVLLGDRISPQAISIQDRSVVVSFAGRAPNEPVSSPPSIGLTRKLRLRNGLLTK